MVSRTPVLVYETLFCKWHNHIIFIYKLSFLTIFLLKCLPLPPFWWNTAILVDFFVSVPIKPILWKSYLPPYKKGQVKLCRSIHFQQSIHLWICCNFLFIWTSEKSWKWGVPKLLSETEKLSKRLWKTSLFFCKITHCRMENICYTFCKEIWPVRTLFLLQLLIWLHMYHCLGWN